MKPVVIVGAGPAGMMLAYQLASNGVPVHVLERHKDFDREFRGEFAQPSVLEPLEQLGVLEVLRRTGRLIPIKALRMHLRTRAFAVSQGPDGTPAGQAVHQPSFLGLLHEQSGRFPGYQLSFSSPATGLVHTRGRVTAVTVRRDGRDDQIETDLVVVCNGRSSALRKALGSRVVELQPPSSVLWLRFDLTNQPHPLPETLDGFVMRRGFYLLYPTYGRRVQLMWRRKRNAQLDWKSPVATLKQALLADAPPHWRVFFELFNEATERQQLSVVCDRLARWWAPGALFLGDAAHTMSPVGAQGLNVAIRDAIVAANHLIRSHRAGQPFSDNLLAGIEAERRPEIEPLQTFQVRAGRIFDAPTPVQWLMANAVIPAATRIQGANYLRQLQFGVTDVRMEYPSPIQPTARPAGIA